MGSCLPALLYIFHRIMVNIKDGAFEVGTQKPFRSHPSKLILRLQPGGGIEGGRREEEEEKREERIEGRAIGASATALTRVGPSDDGRGSTRRRAARRPVPSSANARDYTNWAAKLRPAMGTGGHTAYR
ncbi:hypothetical protein GW17_00024764 [Ensete ventricosum]|nr:hypothetical protein GW17_00024764 [Ensete ventricosum]